LFFQVIKIFYQNKIICKEIKWQEQYFHSIRSTGFWNSKQNQRKFFEEIANKFGIKKNEDWGKLTHQQILESGGSSILTKKYKGKLHLALKEVFPGLEK
jgi:phage anti-repressor protein